MEDEKKYMNKNVDGDSNIQGQLKRNRGQKQVLHMLGNKKEKPDIVERNYEKGLERFYLK